MKSFDRDRIKSRAIQVRDRCAELFPMVMTAAAFVAGGYILGENAERKGRENVSVQTTIFTDEDYYRSKTESK